MKRFWIILAILFFMVQVSTAQAGQTLETYSAKPDAGNQAQVVWKLSGQGKLNGDMLIASNGNLLLPSGSGLTAVDLQGSVLWNVKTSGNIGRPVCYGNSIYLPGASSINEIKLNGAHGWTFSVYPSEANSKYLACSNTSLYLPLTSGLYTLDLFGRFVSLSPWDTTDQHTTKLPLSNNIMACASNRNACFVIYGDKDGSQMVALDTKGNILWKYWLGDLKHAYIMPGESGEVFVVTDPKSSGKTGKGQVYAFDSGDNTPRWRTVISDGTLSSSSLSAAGNLYLTGAGKMYSLDAKTGSILWTYPYNKLSSPLTVDNKTGHLFAGCSDDRIVSAEAQTGQYRWEMTLDGAINQAPVVGPDGFIYVATDKGSLYKIRDTM